LVGWLGTVVVELQAVAVAASFFPTGQPLLARFFPALSGAELCTVPVLAGTEVLCRYLSEEGESSRAAEWRQPKGIEGRSWVIIPPMCPYSHIVCREGLSTAGNN
jgi:hypothetical protein